MCIALIQFMLVIASHFLSLQQHRTWIASKHLILDFAFHWQGATVTVEKVAMDALWTPMFFAPQWRVMKYTVHLALAHHMCT